MVTAQTRRKQCSRLKPGAGLTLPTGAMGPVPLAFPAEAKMTRFLEAGHEPQGEFELDATKKTSRGLADKGTVLKPKELMTRSRGRFADDGVADRLCRATTATVEPRGPRRAAISKEHIDRVRDRRLRGEEATRRATSRPARSTASPINDHLKEAADSLRRLAPIRLKPTEVSLDIPQFWSDNFKRGKEESPGVMGVPRSIRL